MDVKKLLENEDFIHAMENARDCAEATEVFRQYGFEVSEEELQKVKELCKDGELSEDALENVAGGRLAWLIPTLLWPTVPVFPWMKR